MNKLHLLYKRETGKNVLQDEIYLCFKKNKKGKLILKKNFSSVEIDYSSEEPEMYVEIPSEEYVEWLEEKLNNI